MLSGVILNPVFTVFEGCEFGRCGIFLIYDSRSPSVEQLDRLKSFTQVESVFCPQLNLHYEKLTDLWYEVEKRKIEETAAAE